MRDRRLDPGCLWIDSGRDQEQILLAASADDYVDDTHDDADDTGV